MPGVHPGDTHIATQVSETEKLGFLAIQDVGGRETLEARNNMNAVPEIKIFAKVIQQHWDLDEMPRPLARTGVQVATRDNGAVALSLSGAGANGAVACETTVPSASNAHARSSPSRESTPMSTARSINRS